MVGMPTTRMTFEMLWNCIQCDTLNIPAKTFPQCPGCGAAQRGDLHFPKPDQATLTSSDGRGRDWECERCEVHNGIMERTCSACGAPKGNSRLVKLAASIPAVPKSPKPLAAPQPAPKPQPTPRAAPQPTRPAPVPRPQPVPQPRAQPVIPPPTLLPPIPPQMPPVVAPIGVTDMSNRSFNWGITLAIISGVLALGFIITCAVVKKDVDAEVQGHSWVRRVQIETYTAETMSDWCDLMPTKGATMVGIPVRAERSTKKVEVGKDCDMVDVCEDLPPCKESKEVCTPVKDEDCKLVDNGDKTGSMVCPDPVCTPAVKCPKPKCHKEKKCTPNFRDEPVYDMKCTFTTNHWVPGRVEEAKGTDQNPIWPIPTIAQCQDSQGVPLEKLGCERAGKKEEHYEVYFRNDSGKAFPCSYTYQNWMTFPVGSKWQTREGMISGSPDCATMKPRS